MEQMLVSFPHLWFIACWLVITCAAHDTFGGTGLVNALKLLQPIKDKYSNVTYADLFQLASATAIEVNPLFWFKVIELST